MELKWDYKLLADLTRIYRPDLPRELHSKEAIMDGRNCPARVIQRNVKLFLRKLPPEAFL